VRPLRPRAPPERIDAPLPRRRPLGRGHVRRPRHLRGVRREREVRGGVRRTQREGDKQ
jgi:hypothetical protein